MWCMCRIIISRFSEAKCNFMVFHFGALFHTQALHTALLIQAEFITASEGYRVKHATIHRMIHTTVDNKRLNNDAIQKIQPHKLCALVCVIESE